VGAAAAAANCHELLPGVAVICDVRVAYIGHQGSGTAYAGAISCQKDDGAVLTYVLAHVQGALGLRLSKYRQFVILVDPAAAMHTAHSVQAAACAVSPMAKRQAMI
jgi:hypothetical protein